jgi:hypothetical protein
MAPHSVAGQRFYESPRRSALRTIISGLACAIAADGSALASVDGSAIDPARYYTGITSNIRVRLAERDRGAC